MRWSVFDFYVMTYFVADGGGFPDGDFALEARYLRSLGSEILVQGAFEEMRRLAETRADAIERDWLVRALPAVERGDTLLALFTSGQHLEMYFNGALCAKLDDPIQVPMFAGIWLSEKTRAPELRLQLLGLCPPHA